MASKREEVVFLPWGNLLQTAKGHYSTLATERRGGGCGGVGWGGRESGGNRTGVNNLQQADAEVGRCAGETRGREKDSRGGIWHKKT